MSQWKLTMKWLIPLFIMITLLPLSTALTTLTNCTGLQGMLGNLTEDYELGNNIDCSDTINWNSGDGFNPIGNHTIRAYQGTFDGKNYTIYDLYIDRSTTTYVGLFGTVEDAIITNVGLENVTIVGGTYVGAVAGQINGDTNISEVFVTGNLEAVSYIGGIVGRIDSANANIHNSYSIVDVGYLPTPGNQNYFGGIFGVSESNGNIVNRSYSNGTIYGEYSVGGLGGEGGAEFHNSFTCSNVSGPLSSHYYDGVLVGTWHYLNPNVFENTYFLNHSKNPDRCDTSHSITCNVVDDNESYFFDVGQEPLVNWSYTDEWSNTFDNYYFPVFPWTQLLIVNSPGINFANTTGVGFTINTTQQGYNQTVWYSWNGGVANYTLCTSATHCQNNTAVVPRNGPYNLTIWANDTTNNITIKEINMSFGALSNVAPNLSINMTNYTNFTSPEANFTYNISDDNDYVINATFFLDGSYNTSTDYPTLDSNINFTFDNLSYGNHTFYITVYDSDLATNTSLSYLININTPPNMTSVDLNKTSDVGSGDDLNCTASGSEIDPGDTLTYTYEWFKDGVAQGIDEYALKSSNTSNDEQWYCKSYASDGYYETVNYTSSFVLIGSGGTTPSIDTTNATTAETSINSTATNPTNNNSWINFTTRFTDSDTEKWTKYICSVSDFATCLANASGEILCQSDINSTSKTLSCNYSVTGYTGANPKTYYSFILDNLSVASAGVSGTFEVNHNPTTPTLTSPTNGGYNDSNSVLINFTATDSNSDAINYTIYNSTDDSTYSLLYNGTDSNYTMSELSEGLYYIKAYTVDAHGHSNLVNSTTYNFTVDTTDPELNLTAPSHNSTYTTLSLSLTTSASDTNLDECNYSIHYDDGSKTYYDGTNISCTGTITLTFPLHTSYILDVYAIDLANNSVMEEVNFTIAESGTGGGGASQQPDEGLTDEELEQLVEEEFKKQAICGNGVCQDDENPISCPEDCPINVDALFCVLGDTKCSAWVFNFLVYGIVLIAGYTMYKKQRG